IELEEITGLTGQLLKGLGPVLADEAVRVMRRGDIDHANGHATGEEVIQNARGGLLSGEIRIKTEDHLRGVAPQDPEVLGGEGGSLGSHDVGDARHETGDQVELSLADDG